MTTQADIKLVIDQLQNMERATPSDEITIYNATDALETLGNQVTAQAAVIEKLRDALHITANKCQYLGAEKWGIVAKALSTPTDSTQVLQEWLDSVLGGAVCWTDNAGSFCFGHSANTPIPLFKKPGILK